MEDFEEQNNDLSRAFVDQNDRYEVYKNFTRYKGCSRIKQALREHFSDEENFKTLRAHFRRRVMTKDLGSFTRFLDIRVHGIKDTKKIVEISELVSEGRYVEAVQKIDN